MKRRKKIKIAKVKYIIPFFFIFLIFSFSFLFRIKNLETEPDFFLNYLSPYFKEKTLLEIFSNLKKVMRDFPEIKKIEMRFNIIEKKLTLKIKNSEIIAQICDKNNCFYLDNYAEIIEPGIKKSEQTKLKIFSFLPIEKNTLLNPEIENFLKLLFEYANWKPLVLKEIKIYSNFDIGVIDAEDREFLFEPTKNIEEQIKKLHIFLIKNFQGKRIDLRIEKKIYFK